MPAVSIILPTYNRAKFLPEAFAAIQAQQWTDWELIVIDDGSTDNTRELVPELTRGWQQPVRYIHQENQGAYGARNTGLDHATGKYIAFYDSDDLWLSHHLQDCTEALESNEDVDWVYGASRVVDFDTGQTLSPSTLESSGKPRAFAQLAYRQCGGLRIIEDVRTVECALTEGMYAGLQNSLVRSVLFGGYRFETRFRNEAEDALAAARAIVRGHRIGYFPAVHVVYRVHSNNSSASAKAQTLEKRLDVHRAMIAGLQHFADTEPLSQTARYALRRGFAELVFWRVGYAILWQGGRREEALRHFRRGITLDPWSMGKWKTYLSCRAKHLLALR